MKLKTPDFIMDAKNEYDVYVLFDGYSSINDELTEMQANCSCTLIKGPQNIIVDTMTAWDRDKLISGIAAHNLIPDDINYVICSHGHSDHIGNNNVFLNAKHIVGFSISYKSTYYIHSFEKGDPFIIDENICVLPTPGHTMSDVTVIVKTKSQGVFAVAGDLFESSEDIDNPQLWLEAGSESPELQKKNRLIVAQQADHIVPGHGPVFTVSKEMVHKLSMQLHS